MMLTAKRFYYVLYLRSAPTLYINILIFSLWAWPVSHIKLYQPQSDNLTSKKPVNSQGCNSAEVPVHLQ